jgi:signal peptidase
MTEHVTTPDDTRARGGILRLLITSLVVAVLAVIVGIGVLAIVVPAATGSRALTVLTSSMEPGLPPGTMVVVRPTDVADIEPGTIVTYQLESGKPTLVTHRVTQRLLTADGDVLLITKGDANAEADAAPVREVQVVGTVWYAIPYVGWAATAITGPQRSIIITVVIVALFAYAVWACGSSLYERSKRRRREPDRDTPEFATRPGDT